MDSTRVNPYEHPKSDREKVTIRNGRKIAASFAAAAAASVLALGVGVGAAQAASGQITNATVVAAWNYTWTHSSASSYSGTSNHYALAKQDGYQAVVNEVAGRHAAADANGSASNHNDNAAANVGWR